MNKQVLKEVLIFAGGLVVGAAGSWFACKTYYQKKAEEEIASVEKAFTDKIHEVEDEKDVALDAASKALLSANDYHREDPGSRELLSNKSTLDGILQSSAADRIDYTTYYAKNSKETIEVDDHPRDDLEEEEDGIGVAIDGNSNTRAIYEISYDDYGNVAGYDYKELYFYAGDGVMLDDSEDFIDNPEFLVGDVLDKSGFKTNDEKSLYIRNESLGSDFEVIKVLGTYA